MPSDTPAIGEVGRDSLADYLAELLEVQGQKDFGPNGLQVEGRDVVRKVVTGVSSCVELFRRARELDADAVLVHHGLFWDGQPSSLVGFLGARVRELIRGEINLYAYHLPLDRHRELGNNGLAARAFGLTDIQPFAEYHGLPVGYKGRFPDPIPADALVARCEEIYGQTPIAFRGGPDPVETLGIVSGGAQGEIHQALAEGLDAFVTGEATEWTMNVALEGGIHFLSAGHYATERLGVRALGAHLAERFGLDVEFVDVPNPV